MLKKINKWIKNWNSQIVQSQNDHCLDRKDDWEISAIDI